MYSVLKRLLIGRPLDTREAVHERLSKKVALAVFSADAIASSAAGGGSTSCTTRAAWP